MKQKASSHEHPLNHLGQITFFVLFTIIWIIDSFLIKYSTFLSEYIDIEIRLILSIIFFTTFFLIFKSVLKEFSNKKNQDGLIITGPFKFIRHPMYLACIIFYLALSILTTSIISFLLTIIIFIFYNEISKFEEKYLSKKFGKGYSSYLKKTNRWIPIKIFKIQKINLYLL